MILLEEGPVARESMVKVMQSKCEGCYAASPEASSIKLYSSKLECFSLSVTSSLVSKG